MLGNKSGMFRFNPGKQRKIFPDYNPYTIKRCNDYDLARGKVSLTFLPNSENCAGCKLLKNCFKNKEKSLEAKLRKYYLYKMERLLNQKHLLDAGDRMIQVGFRPDENKHLYSDAVSRSRVLQRDYLEYLDTLLKNAKYKREGEITHPRKDSIQYFYYFQAELHNKMIRLNIAQRIRAKDNGKTEKEIFLYSINDVIRK
nr:MAG TPA: hypothetical protein [Bacteriophage sp.]